MSRSPSSALKSMRRDSQKIAEFENTSHPRNDNLNLFPLSHRRDLLRSSKLKMERLQKAIPNLEKNIREIEDDKNFHSTEQSPSSLRASKKKRRGKKSRKSRRRRR